MLWKSLLQVSCLFLCTGLTRGRIYSARKKPAGSALQRNRFGPHMCHSAVGAGIGCCPGWAPSPITGLCVIPLCSFGCGSGSCIAPNVCSCRGGQQSISCPDDGAATGFLSQYAEVSPGKTSSSCLSAMCEQSCLLISGSPVCSCFHGYSLSKDGRSCYDVDECSRSRSPGPCQQQCRNSLGSYRCLCFHGYQIASNGRSCIPLTAMTAVEVPGGCGEYGCTLTCNHGGCEHISRVCPPGFTMREMENGVTCIDIDECETASCDGICLNTDGGFVCECRPGMQLSADRQSCVDIDECSANRALCQQKCRNSYGSYKCLCSTGFTLHGNGHSCIDVNECRRPSGARLCQHSCQNTFGSFLCACRVGFQLHVDKVSCNDVDECSLSFDHTTSPCRHLCTNTFGSYRCSCHQGYQLASDGHSCEELTDLGATLSLMFSSHKDALPTTFLPPYPQAFMTLPQVLHVDGSLWTEAGCLHCTCQAGIVLCDNVTCSVPCSHPVPMPDECCPSCEGCLFEGIERTEGDVFPPTVDDCIVCICIAGNVTCINPDCPDITCQNPVMSDCCLRCPAECFFHGETFPHGAEFSRDGDKCSSCICRNGEVECFFAPCPTLDCPREDWLLEPGQCCFRCQEFQTVTGCPVDDNGIEFPIGQIWSPGDPCEICVCQADSSVVCKRTDCVETCPHPILIPGQCCPDCSAGCSYGRIVVQNNESFPSPSDSCLTCICLFGSVACSPRECTVSCTYPFHAEGECCPICRDCTYEGRKVLDGQAFLMEKEPCTQCTCQSGEVNCEEITCQVSCSEPYTPPGECCATCSECLYEDQVLEDGGYYVSKADPCILCYCEAGNVHCDWRGDSCPLLVCEQPPVHAAGTCCPVCPEDDELPLDSHILSHFEEMEPMKYFRNPRGVTNQLVKAVNALTPATYPKEQSKLRKLILRRKSFSAQTCGFLLTSRLLKLKNVSFHKGADTSDQTVHSFLIVLQTAEADECFLP
ncbi:hypothetical protein NDU88_002303 [Pleurodeles waltl]|uniref:von Willebrand factor C and EGF domain-containing protein n=1 Tax=Pleurodeles waltl TaxID=8319 RepID=A0AAV7TM78_PLEWA|nr:hypothetical protein NDU88_002303 [Pleurodeles waltl]